MQESNSVIDAIKGPLVPILPAFDVDESLDLESTCKWVDWLIGKGIRLFWTTWGSTSYGCLSDSEIMDLTKAVAEVTRGRAIFIASSAVHWSTRHCIDFTRFAADCGADVVKLQVGWMWNPSQDQVFEHYRRIAEESPIPLFAYTVAHIGITQGMTNDLLKRILDLPQFVGMKNDSGDFYEQTEYLRTIKAHGSKFVSMTGGSMQSFLHGHKFGARAFATGVGIFAPQIPIAFTKHLTEGREDIAARICSEYEQPLVYGMAAIGHLSSHHAALHLAGLFKSPTRRFPFRTLTSDEISAVEQCLTLLDKWSNEFSD